MKRRSNIAATLVIAALLLVGSGCDWGDITPLIDFMNEWSTEKGYTDANGNPTPKAAKDYLMGTGDPMTDAALGAGAATKDLNDTDKALEKVSGSIAGGKHETADAQLKALEKMRPNDWAIMNQRVHANIMAGRFDAADEKLKQADENACKTDRCKIAMYENRINVLYKNNNDLVKSSGSEREKECKRLKVLRNSHSQLMKQYELMAFSTPSYPPEAASRKQEYERRVNTQANEVLTLNGELGAHCGGAI